MSITMTRAALAVALATAAATAAVAAPTGFTSAPAGAAPAGLAPAGTFEAQYRRHHRRSYGTGYHGRGTRTGGPVGGLPSRN